MKKPTPEQYLAYQQAFDYFNRKLFESSLPGCMLGHSRRKSGSYALFSSRQWRKDADAETAEIRLNLKLLSKAEPIEVMAALVRQMVHLWQEKFGRPFFNGYYNRKWAKKMEEIGLIPSMTGLPGGKRTGQGIQHYIEVSGRFERAFRDMPESCLLPFRPMVQESEKRRGYTLKAQYKCTGCGAKVWGRPGLEIICGCCGVFAGEGDENNKDVLIEKVYRMLAVKFDGPK